MHNNYIYVVNNKFLTKIILNGLFNDPEQIHELNCPGTDTDCPEFLLQEFPIDSDLIDNMYKLTLDMLLLSYRQPIDTENNSKDVDTAQGLQ